MTGLLPDQLFEDFLLDVLAQINALEERETVYETLVALTEIYMEQSDRLFEKIQSFSTFGLNEIQCAAGCSTCCLVPSEARPNGKSRYAMSILDMIILVENFPFIKSVHPDILTRSVNSVFVARQSDELVPCPQLLPSGACGIYRFRPAACKIWFSKDLMLCIKNRDMDYQGIVNPTSNEAKRLLHRFETLFMTRLQRITPELSFFGHDFLISFEEIAKLDAMQLFPTLRERINSRSLTGWEPF